MGSGVVKFARERRGVSGWLHARARQQSASASMISVPKRPGCCATGRVRVAVPVALDDCNTSLLDFCGGKVVQWAEVVYLEALFVFLAITNM